MSLSKIFEGIAPMIINSLPIPGFAGEFAKKMIGNAFGVSTPKTEEDAHKLLMNATPEQIAKLKELENDFALQMRQMGINEVKDLEALAVQDRDSARNREIQIKDRVPALLAAATTAILFACLIFLAVREIPDKNHDVILILVTAITTGWVGIQTYYFGSSAGSKKATEALTQIAKS